MIFAIILAGDYMRKILYGALALALIGFIVSGCNSGYQKYSAVFFDTFDTAVQLVAYTRNEAEFDMYFEKAKERFMELHKLFDKYHEYEGINNIKTINDNAGIKPVKVSQEIIDLILFCKEWYEKTGGRTNIAMGPVLEIWHQYREDAEYDPANAQVPPMDKLVEASKHTDINKVIVNKEESTVYLADKGMSLDVGAVAKGYATKLVISELAAQGLESAILSPGGNIHALGKPLDGIREKWGIGIQDPDKAVVEDEENILDVVFINDASVVTSGDYQRYYIVDGKTYHHLIDPETLMPAEYFRSVTIITKDSGVADFLSTTVFLMPLEEGMALIDSLEDTEAYWVLRDRSTVISDGLKYMLRSHGATGGKK